MPVPQAPTHEPRAPRHDSGITIHRNIYTPPVGGDFFVTRC